MRLVLEGERRLRLQAGGGGLEIESTDPRVHFSPLHMLAGSLATCTLAVLAGWAEQADLDLAGLEILVEWEYVEKPYRVGAYEMTVLWPGLPPQRRDAALRVVEHCTVEQTLKHPPEIRTRLQS